MKKLNIIVDITEYDAETFKELVNGNVDDDMFSWTFPAEEEDTEVEITFRKEINDKEKKDEV